MMKRAMLLVGLFGCAAPGTYVRDVSLQDGELVLTRCDFDYRGHATSICRDEVADGEPQTYPTDDTVRVPEQPDPRSIAPEPAKPAPSGAVIARALAAPGVHRLVELCRSAYAADLAAFRVQLTIAPTGAITAIAPRDVPDRFGECAARALHTANLAPFDGAPVTLERQLTL